MNSNNVLEVEKISYPEQLTSESRSQLLRTINSILETNWRADTPHFNETVHPFHSGFVVMLLKAGAETVGYSVFKIFKHGDANVVYRFGAAILPQHQKKGGYRLFTQTMIEDIFSKLGSDSAIYYCFRTRNSRVWNINADLCSAIVPKLYASQNTDATLELLCLSLAEALYPGAPIEPENMVMRRVYTHLHYYKEPRLQPENHELNLAFDRIIPHPDDAFFSTGILKIPSGAYKKN